MLILLLRRQTTPLTFGQARGTYHRTFGAPGDYGYSTPLGRALAALYSAPACSAEEPAKSEEAGNAATAQG